MSVSKSKLVTQEMLNPNSFISCIGVKGTEYNIMGNINAKDHKAVTGNFPQCSPVESCESAAG